MTLDQLLHLLAVLAWPVVAVIVGWTLLRVTGMLCDAAERVTDRWRRDLMTLHGYWSSAYWQGLVEPRTSKNGRLTKTSEAALLTILAANGGFPAAPGDAIGRQLVREIRKLYSELDMPTQAPQRRSQGTNAGADSPFDLGDLDELEPDDESESDNTAQVWDAEELS